jgi:hypothetical protein
MVVNPEVVYYKVFQVSYVSSSSRLVIKETSFIMCVSVVIVRLVKRVNKHVCSSIYITNMQMRDRKKDLSTVGNRMGNDQSQNVYPCVGI